MTERDYQRYWKRITHYGFTPEEAFSAPPNKPLWMVRLESEEGRDFKTIVNGWRACGGSLSGLALSIGVSKDAVCYHVRKLVL